MQPLVPLVFHNLPSLYPPSFRRNDLASFIVDSCRDLRFSLEMWDWRRTIAWGRCTPLTIVDQFGTKISGFTPSYETLGRLLKKKKKKMMRKIRISHMSDFSCGETKVHNDP